MSCIAKSIGLIQPPHLNGDGDSLPAERSPGVPTFSAASSDAGDGGLPNMTFNSSFGSLSMLEVGIGAGDDASSVSASAAGLESRALLGLDNEVEILFFDASSTLVMAGERDAGVPSGSSYAYDLAHQGANKGCSTLLTACLTCRCPRMNDPRRNPKKRRLRKT